MLKQNRIIKIGDVSIGVEEYASQGNAVLGIRDSGKSYTSMVIAEQLIESGIPVIAFDPIGVWRFLRVPGKGKGFQVVVAGGEHGDFDLTPENAPKIVEAAMKNNVSLIIDLFSINLSKSDWKRIVESSVRLLLHQNRKYGLRHIFIEEAAEFAPQRIGLDQGRVYAEIEKLARMGGNSMLGYTLINQRSEEVNKAVLELCDCLFLHRQKGRNSLTALGKWLDIAETTGQKELIKSLPLLPQGQCWVWSAGSNAPVMVKVQEKQSFHPDRRRMLAASNELKCVNVEKFVMDMKEVLQKEEGSEKALSEPSVDVNTQELISLRNEVETLQRKLALSQHMLEIYKSKIKDIDAVIRLLQESPAEECETTTHIITDRISPKASHRKSDRKALPKCEMKILSILVQYRDGRTKTQVAVIAGYSANGGGFNNALGALRSAELIERNGDHLKATHKALEYGPFPSLPKGRELFEHWCRQLPRAERLILEILFNRRSTMSKNELAVATGYEASGGGFNNALGRLRTLELISGRGELKVNDAFYQS